MFISGTNSWNLFLKHLIVEWLVFEIFTKDFLNVKTISSGLVNVILFSITAEGAGFEVYFSGITSIFLKIKHYF